MANLPGEVDDTSLSVFPLPHKHSHYSSLDVNKGKLLDIPNIIMFCGYARFSNAVSVLPLRPGYSRGILIPEERSKPRVRRENKEN